MKTVDELRTHLALLGWSGTRDEHAGPLSAALDELDALRAEKSRLVAALLKCRDCGKPATRLIDHRFYCDEWGEEDEDLPSAMSVRAIAAAIRGAP